MALPGLERVAVVDLGLNLRGPQTLTESAVLQKTHLVEGQGPSMSPRASGLPGEMRGLDEAGQHREVGMGLTTRAVLTLGIKTDEHFIKLFMYFVF